MERKLTVGSLFSGIGGLELGLERTGGFTTVWQCELDDYATRVLERHWPGVRRWRDVKTFPPDATGCGGEQPRSKQSRLANGQVEDWQVDLICGGFPCQDISYAGRGAGLAGERSGLFYEVARIVRVLEPRYVLLENVSALLTRGLDAVLGTLASLGYDSFWNCVPAAAVGAPHIRDRVFVVGVHSNTHKQWRQVVSDSDPSNGASGRPQAWEHSGVCCEKDLPNPDQQGLEEWQRQDAIGAWAIRRAKPQRSEWWSAQCRLGIHPDGLSSGLDGCGGWECGVPRVTTKQKNRVDRLRCLGNAVVPQVAEYIGRMIVEFEKRVKAGGE